MTLTDIIEGLENLENEIDDSLHIPEETRSEIISCIDSAIDRIDGCINEYGDESDIEDDIED